VTVSPYGVWLTTGSLRAGSSSRLAIADNSYIQFNSTQGRTSWYGRFSGVPRTLKSLKADYTGSNSLACSQTVSAYNWSTGFWVTLGSQQVGPTPVTVSLTPTGTLSGYVSGVSGNGDVAVRVACTRTDLASFYASADQLRIQYTP
jgi:hypothetical protein